MQFYYEPMSRGDPFCTGLLGCAVVAGLGLAVTSPGCKDREVPEVAVSSAPACRQGQRDDPARAQRIRRLLRSVAAGKQLLGRAPARLRVCFAKTDVPALATDGIITLDQRATDAASAARLGHLLLHAVEGMPMPSRMDPHRSCEVVVQAAMRAEARAHGLELKLQRALGVQTERSMPHVRAYWNAPVGQRVQALLAFFLAHPQGSKGLPGYVAAYTQRCEDLRRP